MMKFLHPFHFTTLAIEVKGWAVRRGHALVMKLRLFIASSPIQMPKSKQHSLHS